MNRQINQISRHLLVLLVLFATIVRAKPIPSITPQNRDIHLGSVCTTEDIVHGEWVVHKPLTTRNELLERYHLSKYAKMQCDPLTPRIPNPKGGADIHDPAQALQRVLQVASPELIPRKYGCRVLQPTRKEMIKRLLRARNGLVLVGDSLTEHHTSILEGLLVQDDGGLIRSKWQSYWAAEFWLNPAHSDTEHLLRSAGVAASRLDVPLVTFWRHHHLLDHADKAVAFADAEDRYEPNPKWPPGDYWYPRMIEQAHGMDLMENHSVLEEPTVLILNLGAHLRGAEFGDAMTESDYILGMKKTVEKVESIVAEAPIPISAMWRTLSPGHIDCGMQTVRKYRKETSPPYLSLMFLEFNVIDDNSRTHWKSPTDEKKISHNYHWFEWMNALMTGVHTSKRNASDFDFMSSSQTSHHKNPDFRLMDVWPMSAKRPDAHMSPPGDCLHWCTTGVQNYWNMLLFHMIMDESRNKDYGV